VISGPLELAQYSSKQYAWIGDKGQDGRPERNVPPERTTLPEEAGAVITLPPYSLSVVRTNPR
jgi:hypothetical protein